MNYFSFFRKATILRKTFSIMTLLALLAGGLTGLVYTSTAYANNGVNTYAVPNTGTLVPGQTMDVHMTVSLDPNDTNPVTSPSCLVNGVNVANTFTNLTSGIDGHFRFTYTVGENDASRAAGQVPINCTLQQTGSVTVTAFDDGNTVAIDTEPATGGGTGTTTTPGEGLSAGSDGVITYFDPTSGTLTNGQELDLHLKVTLDPNDTNPVTSPVCYVNGINVANTFQNLTSGADGHFMFTYTVGADNNDRAAGQVPIECTLSQTGSVTVNTLDDSNTVAIDATASGGGNVNTPQISSVSINPSSGTLEAGDTVTVTYQATDTATTDLAVSGLCHVNAQNVASSFAHVGNGAYQFTYTVGANDGERPAGHIPVSCTFSNAGGSVTATGWTDGNTVAIDTNGDGSIDNGTNNLGFTVVTSPSAGELTVGETVTVSLQDPLPSADVVIGAAGCRINDKDVASTYAYHGNGLYKVSYTVAAGDTNRGAGELPIDCTLENHTGSVHLVAFTDNNTLSVQSAAGGNGGNNGTSTVAVETVPNTGTLTAGQNLEVYLEADPSENNLSLGGSCAVNGVDVAGSFQNLSGGLYKVTYTIGASDSERVAGTVPVSCVLGNTLLTAFTDGNTVAIDANGDGIITAPTGNENPNLASVAATPSTGTVYVGESLVVNLQEGSGDETFTVGACTINGKDVAGSFQNLGSGSYRVTYTVAAGDTNRGVGTVPIDCTLHRNDGQTMHATAFTDSNTVAIYATEDSEYAIPPQITGVTVNPSNGTLSASTSSSTATITLATNKTELIMGDVCKVNDVDVRSSFQNIGGGLYTVSYTAAAGHSDRTAGTIPFLCTLRKATIASSTTATAFTDSNMLAIDVNNDGIFATSTGTTTNPGNNGTSSNSTTTGSVGGDVTGGTATSTGVLAVDSITQVQSTATAGGGFSQGWVWIFNLTVPSDETEVSMKFGDWTHSNGTSTIGSANNIRISTDQDEATTTTMITAANTYSAPLTITGDLNPSVPGRQIQVRVEMQVPTATLNGSYTTTYGIQSLE